MCWLISVRKGWKGYVGKGDEIEGIVREDVFDVQVDGR